MKNFNLITDNLENMKSYDDIFFIIGKKGNIQNMFEKKPNWDTGDNTKCKLMIYNKLNQSIAWKNVKKSSKGYFITLNKRVYLTEFK